MGGLISRWKAKATTVEQLESIDKEIRDLEEFRAKNQRLLKLWVGRLLLYSSLLYLLTCLTVYCLYFPELWSERLFMALPLFTFPVLIWFFRKLLIFLFSKRTERNNDKLEDLKAVKRKILDEVMETETYKNAKAILERFDPDTKKNADSESTPARPQMVPRPGQELRQRGVAMRPPPITPPPGARPPLAPGGSPTGVSPLSAPGGPPEKSLSSALSRTPCSPIPGVGMHPPGPPLPRPILPRDRGAADRVIEYLIGDGPQNRYALICQQCFSHNGMALREEFEYLAFRCAYCYLLNPARKTRPQAPRLPEFSYERRLRRESGSPGPSPRSGSDQAPSPTVSGDERFGNKEAGPSRELEIESQSEETQQQEEVDLVPEDEDEDGTEGGDSASSGQQEGAPLADQERE